MSALILATGITAFGCAELQRSVSEIVSDVEQLFEGQTDEVRDGDRRRAEEAYQKAIELRREGDESGAVELLREAAELGHAEAAYELAIAYTGGKGTQQDLAMGATWMNHAADLGEPRAEYLVGTSLYAGVGTDRDIDRGLMFLEHAADRGHSRAQFVLGQAYVDGRNVTRDPAWAARWYGKAARAGHVRAQFAYGVMFASGLGLPTSNRQAYKWLTLAARNGHPQAIKLRETLASSMTEQEIGQATLLAERFSTRTSAAYFDAPTIMYVQHALSRLGYDAGPVDGIVGPRTRSAVRAFQSSEDLVVDGRISHQLVKALRSFTISLE